MKALTIEPGCPGTLDLRDIAEPDVHDGAVLVETVSIGICGTDLEIAAGVFGKAPVGSDRLVIGHESLGKVITAPADSGLSTGDWVVGMVRQLGVIPCEACQAGALDMCRDHEYLEHGIKGIHGFARERWRAHPDRLLRVDQAIGRLGVLLEPASIVCKAWDHIHCIGRRSYWQPRTAAIVGAGSVGLLAALAGASRGLEVHVFDIVGSGPKPQLVDQLGDTYHCDPPSRCAVQADVVLECSGSATALPETLALGGASSVVCLVGFSRAGNSMTIDVGRAALNAVLGNRVVFGSMNAGKEHFLQAADLLALADREWLEALITKRLPIDQYQAAFERSDGVKTVLCFTDI